MYQRRGAAARVRWLKGYFAYPLRIESLARHVRMSPSAFRVGYERPAQFSRESRRTFGAPPRWAVAALMVEAQPAG
jgi:AraC-like DNA-binding protein